MDVKTLIIFFAAVIVVWMPLTGYSQKRALIGISVNTNIYPDQISLNKLSIGATAEAQIGNHSGGEAGLFYRTDRTTEMVSYIDASGSHAYSFTVARRYIAIPLLYKYYAHHINFSVGPVFDLYSGWKQKNDESPYKVQSYSLNPKFRMGLLGKLSKTFSVNRNLLLEPEIRLGSVQTLDELSMGIGIAVKHAL